MFKEIFPKEYYSSDPPKGPNGTAAKVYVAFHIMDVDEISEANMVRLYKKKKKKLGTCLMMVYLE